MKILKKNNQLVCPVCKSEFEFEFRDIKTEFGFLSQRKIVRCPVCGYKIEIGG